MKHTLSTPATKYSELNFTYSELYMNSHPKLEMIQVQNLNPEFKIENSQSNIELILDWKR